MNKEFSLLIDELKQNGEDMELYPTTKEMINVIYNDVKTNNYGNSWLDVGAGTFNLKKYFKHNYTCISDNAVKMIGVNNDI